MKFWIETENLAIDTEEVSAHFYELCKQKTEWDSSQGDNNQIWTSPESELLVIAVIEYKHVVDILTEKLEAVWSTDGEVLEKIKQLDDVLKNNHKATLIKIHPTTASVPYWLVEKKERFAITERVAHYKKLEEEACRGRSPEDAYGEIYEITRFRNLEGIPSDIPGSCLYELKLIKEYKCLEGHVLLPTVQTNANVHPIDDELKKNVETPPPPKEKKPYVTDAEKAKILSWIAKRKSGLQEEKQMVCDWLLERMEGKTRDAIAQNGAYKEYKARFERKRLGDTKQKKTRPVKAFNDHIGYETNMMRDKILGDT